jgi:adenylate cyclase
MTSSRRLSAIMFTDIVGYTTMIGTDENLAIATVTHHRKVIEKFVSEFEGELIQFYGDGSLSIFPSATVAIECAIALQNEFKVKVPVPLRIGIHIGEILIKEGNIFGEGVNIASRIESLGQTGTILFSEDVFQKIRNHSIFKVKLIGEFEFKNVEEAMSIYALSNDGFPVPKQENITGKLKVSNSKEVLDNAVIKKDISIAVLPFENNSSIIEQQYFVDGIADEIRSQLLSINNLKVISRSSCMYFKDKTYTLSQIGKELDVAFALEGRVQAFGDNIKVNVELSDINKNKQLWSLPPRSNKMEDVFILQNNIASEVMDQLKIVLSDDEKNQLNKIQTEHQDAYKYYQQGQELLHRGFGKIDELDQAITYFEKAIEIDPKYSRAYVGLSDTYLEYIFWGRIAPIKVLDKALNAALKALELDSSNGESYGTLGAINYYKFKKDEAANFLNKAIALSPNYLGAHDKLAWISIHEGDLKKALYHFSIMHSLDPLSTKYLGDVGHAYYYTHQYETGIEVIDSMLKNHIGDPFLLWVKGYLYSGMGKFKVAIDTFLQRSAGTKTNWMLAYNYGKIGMTKEATKILNIHLKKREAGHVPGYMLATIYNGLGNQEKALEWLELDYEEGGQGLFFWGLKTDPKFDDLRNESRFKDLLHKIN